jgi:hypothetical protein
MFTFNKHTRLRQSLSAYMDGELSARDLAALEAHLPACQSCREELDTLRLTHEALHSLPEVAAPRSFALTPDMVRGPQRPGPASTSPVLSTAMRLSAASLAVALAAVMVVDNADLGGDGGQSTSNETARILSDDSNVEESAAEAGEDAQAPMATELYRSLDDAESTPQASAAAGQDASDGSATAASAPTPSPGSGSGAGVGGGGTGTGSGTGGPAPAAASPSPAPAADAPAPTITPAIVGQAQPVSPTAEQFAAAPQETEAAADADAAIEDDDGGIGAIGVIEIVLAVLLGASIGCALAITAYRRQGGGTN